MATVWLCEPRSHGRNKAATPLPERPPSVAVPHRSASPALCPCGHAASFRRRASSFVGRPVCKPPERGARVPVCKAARGGHRQACVVGRPVCKPPAERGARAPVCKAARGGHRQVQGCARRAPVRRGLWPGACGVLAAGARARRAARAGCVPRSREAASRQSDNSKQVKRLILRERREEAKGRAQRHRDIAFAHRARNGPCDRCGQGGLAFLALAVPALRRLGDSAPRWPAVPPAQWPQW